MKIVHFSECGGGVERYLQMLIPRLEDKGVKQVLICFQHFSMKNFPSMADSFYKIYVEQSFSFFKILKVVQAVRKILLEEKPDIFYCHSSFGGALGRLASMGLACKVVYNPHGWSFNNKEAGSLKVGIYVFIERMLARKTDRIVTISSFEKQQAIDFHICDVSKLIVIKNGLEIDKYLQHKPSDISKEQGIPADAFVIGMVGRLTVGKSPDIFVRMAHLLVNTIPNAFFVMVGDGEEREKVESLILELNLGNRFLITGWVDNVYDFINRFDIAVLLTRWEGFGFAVAEYMLSKKPLVSTNVGGIPDIVKDGWNGLLIDSIDEKTAASAVLTLYRDRELSSSFIENGYDYVTQMLDVQITTNEHLKLFGSLLNDKIS